MKLFDGTELIEQLLIDQPWNEQKFVVRHELINYLLLHSFGLQRGEQNHIKKALLVPTLSLPPAVIYLDDVSRLFSVFFEDQHRWGITVNIEFFLQVGSFGKALVHIAKLQVVSISKSCQLRR